MIQTIELVGFKSFVHDEIDFGKLTLLTGLNSSGKSSVAQAILLLEKYAHSLPLSLKGHGNLEEMRNPFSDGIGVSAQLSDQTKVGFLCYVKNNIFTSKSFAANNSTFPKVIYIGADRHGPETSLPIVQDSFELGSKGENLFNCIAHYEDKVLNPILKHEKSEGDTFGFNLGAWLGVISPNVKFNYKIQSQSDSSFGLFNDYRAKNVGFGLSYTLPVITALFIGSVTPNSLVIIENPEAHLHPRGQTELARLICKCVEAGTQVLVETHSDHLLNGVRIYSKKSDKKFNEQVLVHWFELDKDKNTIIESATISHNGRLSNWPAGLADQFEINASQLL